MDEKGSECVNIIIFDDSEWGHALPINDERAIHIQEILKIEHGQTIKVGLINKGVGTAEFLGIEGKALLLRFPDPAGLNPAVSPLPITIVLGQPRPLVMQRLLKDINATGISSVWVIASELSEKSYMQSKLWKSDSSTAVPNFRRFLVHGAQQGGHPFLTTVERQYNLGAALEVLNARYPHADYLMLDINPEGKSLLSYAADILNINQQYNQQKHYILAVGPERGWAEAERVQLKAAGFSAYSLGSSILRTETACNLGCGILAMAVDYRGNQI